ncbi:uncharacterized protein [Triticum aestivum]|uniref:uncharacterized protein n=1 Tax=Triticum aestivum TaxID=4565 RepID=UPI001D01D1BD|nr:uncharacterized protein LOC123184921 [Triticum aestivum]
MMIYYVIEVKIHLLLIRVGGAKRSDWESVLLMALLLILYVVLVLHVVWTLLFPFPALRLSSLESLRFHLMVQLLVNLLLFVLAPQDLHTNPSPPPAVAAITPLAQDLHKASSSLQHHPRH